VFYDKSYLLILVHQYEEQELRGNTYKERIKKQNKTKQKTNTS